MNNLLLFFQFHLKTGEILSRYANLQNSNWIFKPDLARSSSGNAHFFWKNHHIYQFWAHFLTNLNKYFTAVKVLTSFDGRDIDT